MSDKSELLTTYKQAAREVADLYAAMPTVTSVVIGGSLARSFVDKNSDIEMYVYYENTLPSEEQIKDILHKLHAPLTRSKKVHWYHSAWGYHTFFRYNGIKFELGYRDVHETYVRMKDFFSEFSLPKHGIHDTPFGHYESGVASCISECVILVDKKDQLRDLKKYVADYPHSQIKANTYNYYIRDAKTILQVKAKYAAVRNDTYNFNACIARAIRSLVIALFTVNNTFYPGDKWNGEYISKFEHKPVNFESRIEGIIHGSFVSVTQKKQAYKQLLELANEVSDT